MSSYSCLCSFLVFQPLDSIKGLECLLALDIGYTNIDDINVVRYLKNLRFIDVSGTRIKNLPNDINLLKNLNSLYLRRTKVNVLPNSILYLKNLNTIDIRGTKINSFSKFISNLKNLENVYFDKEYIIDLPKEISSRGMEAIKNYYKQIEKDDVDYIYEAKMLIVGEPGAGKTTLRRKIIDLEAPLPDDDETTRGIDVDLWKYVNNKIKYKINIWDFGGHNIYHSTHQFFLTDRSLYILVCDGRKENTDFYYWLNVIELLSNGSPVYIVKNEKQDRMIEIDETKYRGEFSNLEESIGINLAKKARLPFLKDKLKDRIKYLEHMGIPFPKKWLKIRSELELLSLNKNYIVIDDYKDICEKFGFFNEEDKLFLSQFLHDLGIILHFQQYSLLKRILILKPEWATNAVYKILDNQKIIRNYGNFDYCDLKRIWIDKSYDNMHDELLQLMLNFKLCYNIPNTKKYIAPQLLPSSKPRYGKNLKYIIENSEKLITKYKYEFMPKGIVSKLIVILHNNMFEDVVWKHGIVIENGKNIAEIVENYDLREITVYSYGSDRRSINSIVMYELGKIHNTFQKRLKYQILLPCNCNTCRNSVEGHFFSYENLETFIEKGKDIQCLKTGNMVNCLYLKESVVDENKSGSHDFYEDRKVKVTINERKHVMKRNNNAWINGSFYVFSTCLVLTILGVISRKISVISVPLVFIAAIILTVIVGVFQLKQDGKIDNKTFKEILKLSFSQIPFIGKIVKNKL